MWLYLAACLGVLVICISAHTHSPCPELFQYVSQKPGYWDGDITLLSDAELQGVWIRIIFDTPTESLHVENNFGEIVPRDNQEYLLKNRNFILKAGEPVKVRISLRYEGDKAPKLIGFRLNARTVCPEHDGEFSWVENSNSQHSSEFFLGDLNNKDFLSSRPTAGEIAGCGTVPLFPGTLSANKKSSEGQWPWNAFIYLNEKNKICAATLISPSHLLTAAHCLTSKSSGASLHPDKLTVHLGEHFTDAENKGVQLTHVISVTVHPGYNPINLENDLAIIRLDKAATITDYVRPVCLWEESSNAQSILRREGVVAGLGFDSDGRYTNKLTHAVLKVVASDICTNAKPDLASFLSSKAFCAGYNKGNAICVGESGSGLSFLKEGPKPVWQLRGMVTVGAGLQNKLVCDETNYIVFADIATHLKWIRTSLI